MIKERIKTYYIDLVNGKKKGALAALFSFFLLLASGLYGFFVRAILFCYKVKLCKSYKPNCRIISVGNITWGGTGQTPLVEAVAGFLKRQGAHPAVLIRGYGKDEVDMLKDKFKDIPVLAGRDRIKTACFALKHYAVDTLILDDGFQHWSLGRDLDIVLIDSRKPFGNNRLIPRGILREPLTSLSRADVFVLTRVDSARANIDLIKRQLRRYNPQAPIYEAVHQPCFLRSLTSNQRCEFSAINNQRVAVVSGIASPETLTESLKLLGAQVCLTFYFPDHYQYTKGDLERIKKACRQHQLKIAVTTEKDLPRLAPLLKAGRSDCQFLALTIAFKLLKDEEKFFSLLKSEKYIQRPYSVLILSDGRAGHLNQSKAVAKVVQERKIKQGRSPGEIETTIAEVKFKNLFCRFLLNLSAAFARTSCCNCMRCVRFCLSKDSFQQLMQAPADIIISAGSSLSAANLFLSYKNSARSVCLMKPSLLGLGRFDLVIAPEHDRIMLREAQHPSKHPERSRRKAGANVLLTKIAPNLMDRQYLQEQAELLKNRLQAQNLKLEAPEPTIGVLIGGNTPKYKMTAELISKVIAQIKRAADKLNCQILVTTSRRTPKAVEKVLKESLNDVRAGKLLIIANENNIPEAVGGILGLSQTIVVSGESISMVSEAVSAQKDVLVFMPEKRVPTRLKQERFLSRAEQDGLLRVVQPQRLVWEIEKSCQQKPKTVMTGDKELIEQAISRVLENENITDST